MSKFETPIEGFVDWLPGELEYSARKAGYDRKIKRAKLPITDPTSMYIFLGDEWHKHQYAKFHGLHYQPFHGKSAQSQLVKFAAGMFDKAALGLWLASESPAEESNFLKAARSTTDEILERQPWNETPLNELLGVSNYPFDETPFATGLVKIMHGISTASEQDGQSRIETVAEFSETAIRLGGQVVQLYEIYAKEHLWPYQYEIPASQLS